MSIVGSKKADKKSIAHQGSFLTTAKQVPTK